MAASPTASSSSAPNAFASSAAAAADATDGPVVSVVSKRIRALRKKQNRIAQMEESLAAGKTLNKEQEEVLRSKPVIAALIDELERLRAPLASAVAEELSSRAPAPAPAAAAAAASSSSESDSSIQDLLPLVYFGSLFDVKPQSEFVATMVARTHERSCCITYDYVTDDAADLLAETDLDAVSALAALAASRPAAAAGVTHRDALEACVHHARQWLRRADEPIHPDSSITYAGVRAKLEKIMASDYYTAQTEMRSTVDVAAAVGSYGAEAVQPQESMVVSPEAPEVEDSQAVECHKDEKEDSQAKEMYVNNQSPQVDAQHVDEESMVNTTAEVPSAEAEQERFDADVEDPEQKDQEFIPRRSYQNQRGGGRGGGRRGYPNGRGARGGRGLGGGGYQNGRGGVGYPNGGRGGGGGYYYDNTGYYQPRNYNNRGRGGRSGGNSYYSNNGGGGPQGSGRVELDANA